MLRKIARSLYALFFFLTVCVPHEPAHAFATFQAFDIDWQAQFKNAPLWSAAFGIDDSLPNNDAKLRTITPGSVLIGDCPHGGHIKFSTWVPPNNIKIWWKHDCIMESSVATPGLYAFQTADFITPNVVPNDHIYFYGMRVFFPVHTQGVRAFALYCNHCKINYQTVDGAGFGFFRGSDFERGHIIMVNVLMAAGNPGDRDLGNMPLVPTSRGMQANDYGHHFNMQAGDARAQFCQPVDSPGSGLGWGHNVGTNDKRYWKVYSADSDSGSVILVNLALTRNLPGEFYPCYNIVCDECSGGARNDIILAPGNQFSRTSNVKIRGGYYSSTLSTTPQAADGFGWIKRGPFTFSGVNLGLVVVQDRSLNNFYLQAFEIAGPPTWKYLRFKRINVSLPQKRVLRAAQVSIAGTANLHWEGGNVAVNGDNTYGAFSFGDNNNQTVNPYVTGVSATGLADGQAAFAANNVKGGLITGNSAAPIAGSTTAVGVKLKTDSDGTHDLVVTGNTLAMPVPVICAPGQGNIVDGC